MPADLIPYQTHVSKLRGSRYGEVHTRARHVFRAIERKTRRRPYVRSAYFGKEKVFFDFFWKHLWQKSPSQRADRLRYLPCALELIERSRHAPISKVNPNRPGEVLHRFAGLTTERELFFVQIKENVRSGRKYLMSVFPPG
ncbi:MAG: Uncharacterized protein G01um1014106_311 [Parcubacteria group bacterium Gr01-1014_106]|nr:MAG: Uncharacterized protein G01um1014106_311 [Parcubacteria group bacterium Gr01-1014_106]